MTDDTHDQYLLRRSKLTALRNSGANPFPNDFKRDSLAADLHARYGEEDAARLETLAHKVTIAGRMLTRRIMGKAAFAHLQDMSGKIQIYLKRDDLPPGRYEDFKNWDIGDILGISGSIFKTKTGELSVLVTDLRLLVKSLHPLPEKFHGLTNLETRYRQRYLDLIMNEEARRVFAIRASTISYLRDFLLGRGYTEVETPMMQTVPGGAAARPFITHHNSLDMQLYLRIAPELYLKRLVVGGLEKVFEINRSFRNEGLSPRHNPEFTMLEFYEAYATYEDLMDLTEAMLRGLVRHVLGTTSVQGQDETYDFSAPFARLTVKEAILRFNSDISAVDLEEIEKARAVAQRAGIPVEDSYGLGKIQIELFEKTVEQKLRTPTFITAYPTEVSPLARRNDRDPFVTDRFEFFVGGQELANGFSELNDPDDQAERFARQAEAKSSGDPEAMHFDADYVTALEYGLPPTAGQGIGVDRLVMLLTGAGSIRDVLLFPHMRPTPSATMTTESGTESLT